MNTRSAVHTFRGLLPALRPEWRGMLWSYLVSTASALCLAGLIVLTAWAVGHAVVDRTTPEPLWWALITGLVLLRALLTWWEMDVSHALAYRVLARLRMVLFDAYARSVPGRRREHSGHAATVAMDDIEKLEFFYAHTVAQIGASLTLFLASLTAAAILLPEAGMVMLAGGIVVASSSLYWARAARRLGEQEQEARSALSTQIVDALGALREVLAYGLVPRIVAETDSATARAAAISRRRELLSQSVTAVRELMITAVVIGVIIAASVAAGIITETDQARLSPAELPALIALALAGVAAVMDATATLSRLHPLVAGAERVTAGINRAPVVTIPEKPRQLPSGPLGLRFRDVSFSYEDRRPTLTSWFAELAPGEHVGLIGPSGSGKSTIIALAARLWDPSAGSIELVAPNGAGIPIAELDDVVLRDTVAMVGQDSTLFHGTVRDNLLRGRAPRSDSDLIAVLERVGASTWIGLDDDLGEAGVRLSGGQRARLCLARALVRRPRVLLIDEVTASLDPATEQVISDVIADFQGTVLIASHRAETLARVERIVDVTETPAAVQIARD